MHVRLPRDSKHWPSPASWTFIRVSAFTKGPTARVSCAGCGEMASLSGHSIDVEGRVTPSVVCPRKGCGWHVSVTLVGWVDAIAEPRRNTDATDQSES
ncbi:hypothetical protein LCGC14_1761110 [marine sediment metagenome]|uniref:Uncharacterized protein n=1 Tax=marine sediment metagenome TaxID=412755 RepID=A0A0F9K0Q5_9ZZZZ